MEAVFKLAKKTGCIITITGLEQDSDQYQPEDNLIVSIRDYGWSLTASLNVITSISSDGEGTTQGYDVVLHDIHCMDESEITLPIDGLYQVTHMVIPTEEWIQYVYDREPTAFDLYGTVYYYNTSLGEFQKLTMDGIVKVDVEELMEVNPENTTIIRDDKLTFTICHLMDCFYKLCRNLLKVIPGECEKNLLDIKLLIRNRDILWMAINTIKYSLELERYFDAQSILETVMLCGGICKDINLKGKKNGCGCNLKSKGKGY